MQLLVSLLFALPVSAIAVHLLLIKSNKLIIVKAFQFTFSFLLLVFSFLLLLTNSDTTVIYVANWYAPYGISLVFDHLTTLMLFIFSLVTVCINLFSFQDKNLQGKNVAFYLGFWLLILAVIGALSTYDIFNLYVWLEVMLISTFILLSASQTNNVFKIYHYAIFNIVGTLLLLLAIALLYGTTGNLNYAKISEFLYSNQSNLLMPILLLFFLGLAIKAGIFPFYFWLPSAYPETSSSSTMLLSSLTTKVMMLVILRLVWLWPPLHSSYIGALFIFIACSTMFFGVMGAANHTLMRNILSFHIISQLGYILLAIFIPTPLAIIAALYFVIHNIFVKTNLLMVAGIIEKHYKTNGLSEIGRVLKDNRLLASIFFIAAMSLAGFPPLSGFWGKLLVLKAAIDNHNYISAFFAILVSLFTLYSMIKIWCFGFCQGNGNKLITTTKFKLTSIQLMAALPLLLIPLVLGFYPDFILPTLKNIAVDLSQPQTIISEVLGSKI